MPLALVVYKVDGVPDHSVLVRPHGNAKSNKAYRRTKESTKSLLKDKLLHKEPRCAIDEVLSEKGGMLTADSAGDIPRDRVQAYNIHRKLKQQTVLNSLGGNCRDTRDMLYVVMEQCKSAEKHKAFLFRM